MSWIKKKIPMLRRVGRVAFIVFKDLSNVSTSRGQVALSSASQRYHIVKCPSPHNIAMLKEVVAHRMGL
jgi:hypothetical protein